MADKTVIYDILYTPYVEPRYADSKYAEERAFYDMTGEKNVFKYITSRNKQQEKTTAFEYLQKNTGVFNESGLLSEDTVKEMKARLKENKGNIWHGFISLDEEQSPKIDTPEKCIALVKKCFPPFFADAHLSKDNIDLMCALHIDRPHHLHIHFVFWEKEPKYKGKDGREYRRKGKIDKTAVDNMKLRLGLFLEEDKGAIYKSRDEAMKNLRELTTDKRAMNSTEKIKKKILALCKDLPPKGRLSYGSKDMEPYRERIDEIVRLLLAYDKRARDADLRFKQAVREREKQLSEICAKHNVPIERGDRLIAEIESDYRRRQGNLVVNLCKFIKPEYYERKPGKKYKTNDNNLKRRLHISRCKVNRLFGRFFKSFGFESELLERDFTHRLQDIEKEIEEERNARALQTQGKENGNEEAESDTK